MQKEKCFYTIGEVSSQCNVPIKTLRYYDEINLLVPHERKRESKYRYYSKDQMLTLFIIRKLRFMGFSLKDIKKIVYESSTAHLKISIKERMNEIRKEIESLKELKSEGELLLERLSLGIDILSYHDNEKISKDFPFYKGVSEDIKVEDIPMKNVIYTRNIKQDYNNCDVTLDRWFEIFDIASKYKVKILGPITLTYHNNQLEQFFKNDCDLEISIEVDSLLEYHEFKQIKGHRAVTAIHIGSNTDIINTHIKAIKWLNSNGYTIAGPISEEYIISPIDIKNEKEHITKIIIPIT